MTAAAVRRAESLLDLGRTAEARSLLARHVAEEPDSVRAWCLLATAHHVLDANEAALEATNGALYHDPDSSWAWRLRALVLRDLDRPQEAAAAAGRSVELQPHDWRTHACLATVLARTHNREAYRHAYEAVQLAPEEAEAHFTFALVASVVDQKLAQDAYRQTLALDPQHAKARNNLGVSQLRSRRPVQAMEGFGAAAAMDPQLGLASTNLDAATRVLLARGRWLVLATLAVAGLGAAAAWQVQHSHGGPPAIPIRAVTVAAILGGWAVAIRHTLNRLPPALRHYALRLPRRQAPVALMVLGLACGIGSGIVDVLVPWRHSDVIGPCLIVGLLVMLWLLAAGNILQGRRLRRSRRR